VIDFIRPFLKRDHQLHIITSKFSLFAFAEILNRAFQLANCRLVLPREEDLSLVGDVGDRASRNRLQTHWLARRCVDWIKQCVEVRQANGPIPQGTIVLQDPQNHVCQGILGAFGFTTDGLGITPGNPLGLVQVTETAEEAKQIASWFQSQWETLDATTDAKQYFLDALESIFVERAPYSIYALILYHLFKEKDDTLDEEQIVKTATGIHETIIWKKLYRFQRDGVVGAIDKLNRFGGCIIADSVGLGKTFEALAVIKYYELRNDRVLVLCPKRLRENWLLYRSNDRRNFLAADRFHYDVLNHTDLSRDRGFSGDIDLSYINWGNYDLVVIDESHNFRNKPSYKKRESRYERLMRRIIRSGVKTRVLMLSATPVNNRLADLKNQIAFITEGDDSALWDHGIKSIETTTQKAQKQFNRWMKLEDEKRTPERLVEMLGFDYFKLLDLLTIARSRRHIEKYYGLEETGRFPERLAPINIKPDVDVDNRFPAIGEINREIRRLNLAAYAPLRYILEHKKVVYDEKYSTYVRGGESIFRQVDREESLIQLMRVNLLKRMESSVHAFALTLKRQLKDVESILSRIEEHQDAIEELDISDIDIDDPTFESLLVGRKIKVLLQDIDLIRWKQDLIEDRNRLKTLLSAAQEITPERDAKLQALRENIEYKVRNQINPGNRKVIVFTAFADTAKYLYEQLAPWAREKLGLHSALITGRGSNQVTLNNLRCDLASILGAFAPRAKELPPEFTDKGEIDLLIATDCISEGQNLQDCDWLINYDIHWNPVRIIQRFGRIDRLGSSNTCIQLVNFWPNMELDEYIDLETRVSGRMVLLDISATGEENVIERQAGDQMNDLEYRRKQLLKLQEAVIELEDLGSGISITDLTLSDFRMDMVRYLKEHPCELENMPMGVFAVTTTTDLDIPPGILFCLRVEGESAERVFEPGYPLAPYALVYVEESGTVRVPYIQTKQSLDSLKRVCMGKDLPDLVAYERWNKVTRKGADMKYARRLLAEATASIAGKSQERAVASLFTPGGTHALKGEFAGTDDIEVVAWLVILPEEQAC
jgi:ERCC4-related helicase